MAKTTRIKNASGVTSTWAGTQIANGVYHTIEASDLYLWTIENKVLRDVGNGALIVNKGSDTVDDLTNPTEGWRWLYDNLVEPRKSKDGDWKVLHENFAHATGNKGINWTLDKYLGPGEEYSENMVIPANRVLTLNSIEGGSALVASHVSLEYYKEVTTGVFMRINPWTRVDEVWVLKLNGSAGPTDITFSVDNSNNELDDLETGFYYGFKSGALDTVYKKITGTSVSNETITVESSLGVTLADQTKVGLTDRVIGQLGNQIASSSTNWPSPPNCFIGNGKNHLKVTLRNEDDVESALITASVNGWHTDQVDGD